MLTPSNEKSGGPAAGSRLEERPRCACAGDTRETRPAAPSSSVQLLYELFFKGRRLSALAFQPGHWRRVDAKYSTAPSGLRQHLFFDREHHARPQSGGRGVVCADREERPALVEERDVRAVIPDVPGTRRDGRAVPRPARLFDR